MAGGSLLPVVPLAEQWYALATFFELMDVAGAWQLKTSLRKDRGMDGPIFFEEWVTHVRPHLLRQADRSTPSRSLPGSSSLGAS